jgi:phosphoribosylformylglycinamidine cyclo-ligase
MRRTFNCGVGMILAVRDADIDTALATLAGLGETAWQIGHVAKDAGPVEYL